MLFGSPAALSPAFDLFKHRSSLFKNVVLHFRNVFNGEKTATKSEDALVFSKRSAASSVFAWKLPHGAQGTPSRKRATQKEMRRNDWRLELSWEKAGGKDCS